MAYPQKTRHKNSTIVYSIRELDRWQSQTRRTEEEHAYLLRGAKRAAPRVQPSDEECLLCGWPGGSVGYVGSMSIHGEKAFGKLFGCPDCWPAPIGDNRDAHAWSKEILAQCQAARVRMVAKGLI